MMVEKARLGRLGPTAPGGRLLSSRFCNTLCSLAKFVSSLFLLANLLAFFDFASSFCAAFTAVRAASRFALACICTFFDCDDALSRFFFACPSSFLAAFLVSTTFFIFCTRAFFLFLYFSDCSLYFLDCICA